MQQVPVLVDTFSSPEEIKAIRSALKSIGFEGTIERSVPPQGEAPWLVLIGMPVGAFLSGFFAAAGKDAWERFNSSSTTSRPPTNRNVAFGDGAARRASVSW